MFPSSEARRDNALMVSIRGPATIAAGFYPTFRHFSPERALLSRLYPVWEAKMVSRSCCWTGAIHHYILASGLVTANRSVWNGLKSRIRSTHWMGKIWKERNQSLRVPSSRFECWCLQEGKVSLSKLGLMCLASFHICTSRPGWSFRLKA